MKARSLILAPLVAVVAALVCQAALAQEGLKRTVLARADLGGASGMEVISSVLEVEPGATVPRHFHHGIEAGYVLDGAMVEEPGKPPRLMATGTSILNLRGVFHAGFKVVGATPLRLYAVHVVDKGAPFMDEGR